MPEPSVNNDNNNDNDNDNNNNNNNNNNNKTDILILLASIPGLKGLLCYQKDERKDIAVHWDKAIKKGPGTKLG